MKKLIIKIGANLKTDLKNAFENPKSFVLPNTHTLYLKNSKEFYEIFSPQRLDLLIYLISNSTEKLSISDLAIKLNRKQEAITRDTILLSKYNLIQKTKEKQKVFVNSIFDSFDLKLN
ncbi:MAG: hypothetical protein PHQ98_02580 [Candidatus ainarchaeum sp.]|nr:hypothetical protein [Candidatus ainarchaeum sp.]